jgi:hypothetical protein
MIRNKRLFVILNDYPWETDLKKGRYYISRELAKKHIVLYISAPPDRTLFKWKNLLSGSFYGTSKIEDGLFVLKWPWWSVRIFRPTRVKDFLLKMRTKIIKKVIRKLIQHQPHEIILYFTHPEMFDYFDIEDSAMKIYNPYDKFSEYGMNGKLTSQYEQKENDFIPKFDMVLCPHQQMVDFFKKYNTNVKLFYHGVDFNHYAKATREDTIVPDDILNIKPPIIGYMGVINERIDFNLIGQILAEKPEWQIVMVGPIRLTGGDKLSFDKLLEKENFYWIGYRDSEVLPNYLKNFDIGTIPFKVKRWVKWIANPLKLHIYTAAGLPFVTCPLENVDQFYSGVYIANDKNEWIAQIDKLLATSRNNHDRTKRSLQAQKNDWSYRVDDLNNLIDNFQVR